MSKEYCITSLYYSILSGLEPETSRVRSLPLGSNLKDFLVFFFFFFSKYYVDFCLEQVQVEVALQQGREKGPTIVEKAKQQGVSLLILGKRKRSSMVWCGLMKWATNRIRRSVVDYCIQNAGCMTVAVRRQGKKLGGYLITTKNHKDFWLLA